MGPSVISFYATDRCNMRCAYCFTFEQRTGKRSDMSVDVAQRVLDLFPEAKTVRTGSPGEPLLNAELPSIVKLVSARKKRFAIATNGTRIRKANIPWQNVAQVNVSMTDADRKKYQSITRVDCLDEVCRGVEYLRSMGVNVINSYVAHWGNVHRLHEFVELSMSLGVERVVMQPLFGVPGWKGSLLADEDAEQAVQEQVELCRGLDVSVRWPPLIRLGKPRPQCNMSKTYIAVNGDGDVALCCRGPGPRPEMGNISQGAEVWSAGAMQKLRERVNGLAEDRPDKCKVCWINFRVNKVKLCES